MDGQINRVSNPRGILRKLTGVALSQFPNANFAVNGNATNWAKTEDTINNALINPLFLLEWKQNKNYKKTTALWVTKVLKDNRMADHRTRPRYRNH